MPATVPQQPTDETAGNSLPSKYQTAYPQASSKKGLQVEWTEDALALGIKHAGLNVNLSQIILPQPSDEERQGPSITLEGQTYYFRSSYLLSLDRQIKPLSDAGVLVNAIVLAYQSGNPEIDQILIHPNCVAHPPNRLGAFNNRTAEGRAWLSATMQFLAERWSRPDAQHGRVVGWIIGNEVNSHWWWANMGRVTMKEFTDDYEQTVRLMHSAIRSQSSSARVYVSLEHHWNMRYPAGDERQAFAGRDFLELFNQLAHQKGDFDWHLAFHPYPENLFEPAFWRDRTATPEDSTPRITPKNLQVLVRFMAGAHMQHAGKTRRIILSEQGFHSAGTPESEAIQAAAFCYAYRLIETFDAIDAFILHRHIDHPHEGGLNLGLRRRNPQGATAEDPFPKKAIYDCFRAADTDRWSKAFEFALPIVNLEQWPTQESTR